jgi:hypothetical protein
VAGIHAARVAEVLRRELDVAVDVVDGHYGEFTVLVDGVELVEGGALGFLGLLPPAEKVCEAVGQRLARTRPAGEGRGQ